jgi:hypothetical protein
LELEANIHIDLVSRLRVFTLYTHYLCTPSLTGEESETALAEFVVHNQEIKIKQVRQCTDRLIILSPHFCVMT